MPHANYLPEHMGSAILSPAGVNAALPGFLGTIEFAHVQRWRFGPDVPHPGVHRAMREFLPADDPRSRIRLAGDYLSSASTNASAVSAERAARELGAQLGAR